MSRTQAVLPGGPRLSDYLSIGVLAQVYPIAAVREALASCGRASLRQRALPAEAMVYYVVALGLFRSVSAREVLRCLMEGLRWVSSDATLRVSGKSSISRARTRLGSAPFEALRAARVEPVADPATRGSWYRGRRLVAFDGSTLNVPDEATNREAFGAPGASRGRAAFPQVRLTALVEVGTRAAFAWRAGAYAESEEAQVEALLPWLSTGMLVLADRGYCGFPLWRRAASTGADLLWRMKANLRLPVLERFDDGSYRSVLRGSGQDRRRSQGECPVRVVEYRLDDPSDAVYRLATTLLDPTAAPAAEVAALYHERWEVETAYDEVKTHILGPGAILRSKTPGLGVAGGPRPDAGALRRAASDPRGGAQGRRGPGPPFVRPRRAGRAPPCREPRRFPPHLRMSGFASACWKRFWKSGWSPVAARRNPAASSGR